MVLRDSESFIAFIVWFFNRFFRVLKKKCRYQEDVKFNLENFGSCFQTYTSSVLRTYFRIYEKKRNKAIEK